MQTFPAASWNLSEREQAELTSQVSHLHQRLAAEVEGISAPMWNAEPGADAWSAEQVVEHILLVESSLMRQILEHSQDAPQADWEPRLRGKEELLRKVLPGEGKAKAGQNVTPFRGLAVDHVPNALAQSKKSFDDLLFSTRDLPMKAILWGNRYFGDLSAFLWLLYIPLHGERHLAQLRRVKTARPGEKG